MVLIPVLLSLLGTAVAVISASGQSAVSNPGIHGFSEIITLFRRLQIIMARLLPATARIPS